MNFFLDENFPKMVTSILVKKGHNVYDIRGTQNEGKEDVAIFQMAQQQKALFLTTDKDFFHSIPFINKDHYGIIIITLRQPNRKNISEKLLWILDNTNLADFKNKIILLRDNSYYRI